MTPLDATPASPPATERSEKNVHDAAPRTGPPISTEVDFPLLSAGLEGPLVRVDRILPNIDVEGHAPPPEVDEDERRELWPRLVEMYADFTDYAARTDRTIPVIRLRPA